MVSHCALTTRGSAMHRIVFDRIVVTLNRIVRSRTDRAVLLVVMLVLLAGTARAQDRRQNEAGQFDFYVLSLSWSPSFCEASAEQSSAPAREDQQCGERRYSFVVH